jgi:hypothetical protein
MRDHNCVMQQPAKQHNPAVCDVTQDAAGSGPQAVTTITCCDDFN